MTGAPRPAALERSARSPGPDIARALMLALIAVANVHLYLVGDNAGGLRGYPAAASMSGADRVVTLLQMLLVDGRAYPLFAALVGYGLVRLRDRHPPTVVRRRALVLVGVGALHGILLFSGDIVGAYGLLALVFAATLVETSPRGLLVFAGLLVVVPALLGSTEGLPTSVPTLPSLASASPLAALGMRAGEWVGVTLFSALSAAPALLVGAWAAHAGILDDPAAHRALLRRWIGWGLPAAVVLGAPFALAAAGWWTPPFGLAVAGGIAHGLGGYAGALGFLGLLGLSSTVRFPGADLLAGAGTWSMTCYVAQSVVFCALLAAWAGGFGRTLGVAEASVIGLATWAVTVTFAGVLAGRGYRGPLELAVRRVTYGPRAGQR